MSTIKPEELIEEVRKYPVLYDQTKEQYRNYDYKDMVWKKVAKELNVEGQEEDCKKKWNGIRDSLRRARQKRKTKSGQGATSTNKYKYEAILEFLIPHLAERKGLSNVPDEENDDDAPETGNESQQHELQNDESQHDESQHHESQHHESQHSDFIKETQEQLDISNAHEPEKTIEPSRVRLATTSTNRLSAEKKPLSAGRKRKVLNTEVKLQETPSSQLMAYILAQKKAESTNTPNERSQDSEQHPVDAFLAGIAPSLKSLDPERLHAAKGNIFNIVQRYELEQIRANNQQRTIMNDIYQSSSAQTSCASTPAHITSSEEDKSHADVYEPSHFSNQVAPRKAPSIITEEDDLSFLSL